MTATALENGYRIFDAEDGKERACRAYLADLGGGFALIGSVPERYTPELLEALVPFTEKLPLLYISVTLNTYTHVDFEDAKEEFARVTIA